MKQHGVVRISGAVHCLIKLESVKRRITMRELIETAVKEYIRKRNKHD